MATERPTVGQWRAWYARFRALITQNGTYRKNKRYFATEARQNGAAYIFPLYLL
jgi:hypothetical protein